MKESMNIFDLAYDLAKEAYTALSHTDAKEKLHKQYSFLTWDEVVEAYMKGCALAEKCYDIGKKARQYNIPDDEALVQLEKDHPGFSSNTYNDALTRGWFLSR